MYDPPGPGPGPSAGGADHAAVRQAVERVVAWYAEQLLAERRSAAPDHERMERLKQQRLACLHDLSALDDAEPEELAAVQAAYEARYRELTQQ